MAPFEHLQDEHRFIAEQVQHLMGVVQERQQRNMRLRSRLQHLQEEAEEQQQQEQHKGKRGPTARVHDDDDDAPSPSRALLIEPTSSGESQQLISVHDLPPASAWDKSWDQRIRDIIVRPSATATLNALHREWLQEAALLLPGAQFFGPSSPSHQSLLSLLDRYECFSQHASLLAPDAWARRCELDLVTQQPVQRPCLAFLPRVFGPCAHSQQLIACCRDYVETSAALMKEFDALSQRYRQLGGTELPAGIKGWGSGWHMDHSQGDIAASKSCGTAFADSACGSCSGSGGCQGAPSCDQEATSRPSGGGEGSLCGQEVLGGALGSGGVRRTSFCDDKGAAAAQAASCLPGGAEVGSEPASEHLIGQGAQAQAQSGATDMQADGGAGAGAQSELAGDEAETRQGAACTCAAALAAPDPPPPRPASSVEAQGAPRQITSLLSADTPAAPLGICDGDADATQDSCLTLMRAAVWQQRLALQQCMCELWRGLREHNSIDLVRAHLIVYPTLLDPQDLIRAIAGGAVLTAAQPTSGSLTAV